MVTDVNVPTTPPTVTAEVTELFAVALDLCFTHTDVPGATVPDGNSTDAVANKPGGFGATEPPQFKIK